MRSSSGPLLFGLLGWAIYHRERLPRVGPAIIIANHNSHLDTPALFAMFPISLLPILHPVAASDYFLTNRIRAWVARPALRDHPPEPLAELAASAIPLAWLLRCASRRRHPDHLPRGGRAASLAGLVGSSRASAILPSATLMYPWYRCF